MNLIAVIVILAVIASPFVVAILIWLFASHGIDKIKHPEEWQTAGSSGERIV